MIKLGFVSAILAEQTFEQVISFAAETGYACVEIMCWPVGKAERRYAGVTHINVGGLSKRRIDDIWSFLSQNGVAISGLEMSQNSARITWKEEELQALLRNIMQDIHEKCVEHGTIRGSDYVDYVKGANIAGFKKVADAMVAYGVV